MRREFPKLFAVVVTRVAVSPVEVLVRASTVEDAVDLGTMWAVRAWPGVWVAADHNPHDTWDGVVMVGDFRRDPADELDHLIDAGIVEISEAVPGRPLYRHTKLTAPTTPPRGRRLLRTVVTA